MGRPNVGKSSLFNALLGRQYAVVNDTIGVTRDVIENEYIVNHQYSATIIDTSGVCSQEVVKQLYNDKSDIYLFDASIKKTLQVVEAADLILFVVNVRDGLTAGDKYIHRMLRHYKKENVVLVLNKCDKISAVEIYAHEFTKLGYAIQIQTYTTEKSGRVTLEAYMQEFIQNITGSDPFGAKLESEEDDDIQEQNDNPEPILVKIAIYGEPNAGKSTLVNTLIQKNECIVSVFSGTTRDATPHYTLYHQYKLMIVDTPGVIKSIGRRSKIEYNAADCNTTSDFLHMKSIRKANQAIVECDVGLLLIDASAPITAHFLEMADFIAKSKKAIIICFNKKDIVDNDTIYHRMTFFQNRWHNIRNVRMIAVSALQKSNIKSLIGVIIQEYKNLHKRIPTHLLNDKILQSVAQHPHPMVANHNIRIKFIAQVATAPPTFILSVNKPTYVLSSYKKYIANQINTLFQFGSVIINVKCIHSS